jgi:hypothetical protein
VVAHSPSETPRFAPAATPRLAVVGDGTLAAVSEPTRIVIVDLPDGRLISEIGADPAALATEVAWVGTNLLVLSRFAAHSTVYLLEPRGPRTIAEIRLEAPMRLFASVGVHALAVGSLGAAVLTASDTHLTPYQFPARGLPVAAGAAGGQFVVALPSSVEEWDPASRMPKRRFRLPHPAVITALGGSDRVVWMTTQAEPTRIDVIALVNRGQPKAHELPEPIAAISGHPRSDLIVCFGESGKLYAIDLDGRLRMRTLVTDGVDRVEACGLIAGNMVGAIAAQTAHPLAIISLGKRDVRREPGAIVHNGDDGSKKSTLGDDDDDSDDNAPIPTPILSPRRGSWRDEVVAWAGVVAARPSERSVLPPPPHTPSIDVLAARFELPEDVIPALVLLYGAHLAGEHGAAPVGVARILGRQWDEALGRGKLAALGIAIYKQSRVMLAPVILRALDELPPRTGTIVGEPGTTTLLGPCAVIEPPGPLDAIAARYVSAVGGGILAARPGAAPVELFAEARARGAVPMLRVARGERVPHDPAILVVTDEAHAEALGVPRLYGA